MSTSMKRFPFAASCLIVTVLLMETGLSAQTLVEKTEGGIWRVRISKAGPVAEGHLNRYGILEKLAVAETMAWFADRLRKVPRTVEIGRDGVSRLGRLFKILDEGRVKGLERTIRLKAIVVAFLLDLLDATKRPSRRDVRASIREVVQEMAENPKRAYSMDELVTRLSMSPTALLGAFKQATGFSPHAYLIKCRIDRAKDMLEQGVPVGRGATALGFRSRRYFTAMFRKSTGSTPLKWLKEKGVR